jgi:type II secretion system protein G
MRLVVRAPFTLVELLTVMAIIGVIMGLIVGGATMASRKSSEGKTRSLLHQMELALEQYRQDQGYFPQQASPGPLQWDESVFKNAQGRLYLDGYPADSDDNDNNEYRDAWGKAFFYQCPGTMNSEAYDLWSKGHDQKHGNHGSSPSDAQASSASNSDDIANWKRQ